MLPTSGVVYLCIVSLVLFLLHGVDISSECLEIFRRYVEGSSLLG